MVTPAAASSDSSCTCCYCCCCTCTEALEMFFPPDSPEPLPHNSGAVSHIAERTIVRPAARSVPPPLHMQKSSLYQKRLQAYVAGSESGYGGHVPAKPSPSVISTALALPTTTAAKPDNSMMMVRADASAGASSTTSCN